MHYAFRITQSNSQKISETRKGLLLRKFSKLNSLRTSLEDCEPLSLFWKNSDHRCSVLTLLILEPDGHRKISALPLQLLNQSKNLDSKEPLKMDGLQLVSTRLHGNILSFKPYTSRCCSASIVQRRPQNKPLMNNAEKLNESCQNIFVCIDSSVLRPSSSDATNSSDMSVDNPKESKYVNKKAKKRGKKKKPSPDSLFKANGSNSEVDRNGIMECSEITKDTNEHHADKEEQNTCDSLTFVHWNSEVNTNVKINEINFLESSDVVNSHEDLLGTCIQSKSGKQARRAPRNPGISRVGSNGNLYGRLGKEQNHSVWQKVQKNNFSDRTLESKPPTLVCSESGVALKDSPLLKKGASVVEPNAISKSDDKNQLKVKASRKLKRKSNPGSKQGYACYLKKESQTNKAESSSPVITKLPSNEIVNDQCVTDCGEDVISDDSGLVSDVANQISENPNGSMLKSHDSLSLPNNHDYNSGSVTQKWVPADLIDPEITNSGKSEPAITNPGKPIVDEESTTTTQGAVKSSYEEGQIQRMVSNENTCLQSTFNVENDSEKLVRAVNDVCKVKLASEDFQMSTGIPIAEIEHLLSLASPVISQTCKICSCDQLTPATLCRHEALNVSLGSIWNWYDMHGSYGLEVKVEDYENIQRFGAICVKSHAYFVPFLSAVQLFGKHEISPADDKNISNGNRVFSRDSTSVQLNDFRWSADSELLFEYFEFEQPQKRPPLFEKIKQLVKCDRKFQGYGDPTKLNSLDLRDLHPRSWYAVAWYPIYKIPDGNFRAAFLTYHSLSPKNMDFRVVGLRSYNAQGECWFRPKHASTSLNSSKILEDRLRTLEHAASLMSRLVVGKENLKSRNRHHDYEFFVSRWR